MKRFSISLLAMLLLMSLVSFAQETNDTTKEKVPFLQIHGQTVGAIQAITLDNDAGTEPHMPWGFQDARGNLDFSVNIADGIDVFFDAYLSSNHHLGQWYDDQGYITITKLPESVDILGLNNSIFKYITLKAGFIPVDYGLWYLIRSDNADVQRNPLVGNYIVDANDVEPSVQISTKPGLLNASLAFGDGTTTGDFTPGRGNEVNGKVWLDFYKMFDLAASFYKSNQSNNGTGYPAGGSTTDLYAGNRSGAQYTGTPGANSIFPNGYEDGDITPAAGQNVTAYQFDGFYDMKPIKIFGMYGYTKDADINGSGPGTPEEAWSYFGGDITYYLTSAVYVAARYSKATSDMYHGVDVSSNPVNAYRVQAGAGLWITKYMLFKLEYVNQEYKNFPVGSLYAGNARFHGLNGQFSVSF
jgi:hypothetical protein